jgi:hypothetical protein
MGNNGGWIKLHRSIYSSQIFKNSGRFKMWAFILGQAAHAETFQEVNGHQIPVKRGEYAFTVRGLAARLGRDKAAVERDLKYLENRDTIRTISETRFCRLTIVNYDTYNSNKDSDRDEHRDEHRDELLKNRDEHRDELEDDLPENVNDSIPLTTPKKLRSKEYKNIKNIISTRDASLVACCPSEVQNNDQTKDQITELEEEKTASENNPPKVKNKTPAKIAKSTLLVWEPYKVAYQARYGHEPLRNAKINSSAKRLCSEVPESEIAELIQFYLTLTGYYQQRCHDLPLLLKDIQSIRTNWIRKKEGLPFEEDQSSIFNRKTNGWKKETHCLPESPMQFTIIKSDEEA